MSIKTPYLSSVGEYFHVYNRGVQKAQNFDSAANYAYFMEKMQTSLDEESVAIFCFCLMPNHFHFLLEQTAQGGISSFMQRLGNSYAKALNNQRGQTGHVFESKYKIKLIDTDSYLIWLSRYIHRNPKEAGIVRECAEWQYSSYQDLIGLRKNPFVSPRVVLSGFSSPDDYWHFVEREAENEPPGFAKCVFEE
jgi:putative transposase